MAFSWHAFLLIVRSISADHLKRSRKSKDSVINSVEKSFCLVLPILLVVHSSNAGAKSDSSLMVLWGGEKGKEALFGCPHFSFAVDVRPTAAAIAVEQTADGAGKMDGGGRTGGAQDWGGGRSSSRGGPAD